MILGDLGDLGLRWRLLPWYEHPGRYARPVQQPREAVPVLRVHEHHLRGRVGEDVLQPSVRVGEVQRYVRTARGDDRDEGDDLFEGARDGHGDPLARPDPDGAQGRGQLVLRGGQFTVGQ